MLAFAELVNSSEKETLETVVFGKSIPGNDIIFDQYEVQERIYQDCVLKCIRFLDAEICQTLTRLNKAGRRYLREDPQSNSKCIAVLAKVKHDLNCLYFHVRENPILCLSYCKAAADEVSGRKRKAADTV